MEADDLLRHARNACDQTGIRYLVTGSIATIAYGEPRFTNDIDILIELPANRIDTFCEQFPVPEFYLSRSSMEEAVESCFQFNVIHPGSGLKIDFIILSESEFDRSRVSRRRQLNALADAPVWFVSPEDVILKKMVYFQEGRSQKHLRDIAGVLRIQGDGIDRAYIGQWATRFGLQDIWNRIIDSQKLD